MILTIQSCIHYQGLNAQSSSACKHAFIVAGALIPPGPDASVLAIHVVCMLCCLELDLGRKMLKYPAASMMVGATLHICTFTYLHY